MNCLYCGKPTPLDRRKLYKTFCNKECNLNYWKHKPREINPYEHELNVANENTEENTK